MKISVFITDSNDIHHIVTVMRHQEGQHIIVNFNDQNVYQCEIIKIAEDVIELSLAKSLIFKLNYLKKLLYAVA